MHWTGSYRPTAEAVSKCETYEKRLKIIGGEGSSCVLQILPRQRGEVGDGVRLSWSGLRTSVSSDWTVSEAGSPVGAADGR